MGSWIDCTLAELGTVVGGATPSTKQEENYLNGTIPWITPKDLSTLSGRFISRGERNITQRGLDSCSAQLMPKNSVLFSSRAPIGYVAISKCELCTNQGFKSIVPNNSTDYMFLYYLLKYNKNAIENMGSGTTFKEVSGSTMKGIRVRVPADKEEQTRIAGILSAIDDKIEENERINCNLLEQASALFNTVIQQSTSVFYSELGSLADVKGGKRLPKGVNLISSPNKHPYIRVRDLNNAIFASLSNDYEYVDDETQQRISRYIVSTGDVLISIVGTIGLTAIVDHTLNNANLTENCVKLTNLKNVTPEYLLLFLRSSQGVEAISKGTVGAVQLKLPIKNLQSIAVPLLCDEELQPLNKTLSAIFSLISANVVEIKQLSDIRNTLLPKLMSGELDVSDVEI